MKRLTKILSKDSEHTSLRAIVFCDEGAIVWGGKVGILYQKAYIGERLCELIKEHGPMFVLDGFQFMSAVESVDVVESIEVHPGTETLVMTSEEGKIIMTVSVVIGVPVNCTHFQIPWDPDEPKNDYQIEVFDLDSLWFEANGFLSQSNFGAWDQVLGVYDYSDFSASFDQTTLLFRDRRGKDVVEGESPLQTFDSESIVDENVLFCPHQLLSLGLKGMTAAYRSTEDDVLIKGAYVDYYVKSAVSTEVLRQMLEMRNCAIGGTPYPVSFQVLSGLWKRVKSFASVLVTLVISDHKIFLEGPNWKELIGVTEAPNVKFVCSIALLKSWVSKTQNPLLSFDALSDQWFLLAETLSGNEFYGHLTSAQDMDEDPSGTENPPDEDPDPEDPENPTNEEPWIKGQ